MMAAWFPRLLPWIVVWLAATPAAHADVADAVTWARQRGCHAPAPLHVSAALGTAALHLSDGQSLPAALAAAGYLATQSASLHISGATRDGDVARSLAAHECATLGDPKLSEMGVRRRGGDVWLVLAAPLVLPPSDDTRIARQIVEQVNQARAAGRRCGGRLFAPTVPLRLDRALSIAARAHSDDMARYQAFDHRGHDGSTPTVRVARAGYSDALVVGENIAAGAMTAGEVVAGWLASPPHCENIMDPRFEAMGLGYAQNLASAELVYWTQDFAAARGGVRPR